MKGVTEPPTTRVAVYQLLTRAYEKLNAADDPLQTPAYDLLLLIGEELTEEELNYLDHHHEIP